MRPWNSRSGMLWCVRGNPVPAVNGCDCGKCHTGAHHVALGAAHAARASAGTAPRRRRSARTSPMTDIESSSVFYRKLNRRLPTIVRGEGVFLYDESGKRYLDACGGAMVASVGHGNKEIAAAIGAQAAVLEYVNGTMFANR